MVGAVVVRGGTVIGEGSHRRAGGPHAEISALRRAGGRARGARPLPDARAVRAPGPHAALRSRGDRRRRVARGRRGAGPEPARRRARHRGAAAGGHRRRPGARALAPARRGAEREVLRLDHARPAVRPRQVGRDAGRPHRVGGRGEPVDHRAGGAAPGPRPARGVRRGAGRRRHRRGRRSAADAPARLEPRGAALAHRARRAAAGVSGRAGLPRAGTARRRDRASRSTIRARAACAPGAWRSGACRRGAREAWTCRPFSSGSPRPASRASWSREARGRCGSSSPPASWTASRCSSPRGCSAASARSARSAGPASPSPAPRTSRTRASSASATTCSSRDACGRAAPGRLARRT